MPDGVDRRHQVGAGIDYENAFLRHAGSQSASW
jgi:hypothetical protein